MNKELFPGATVGFGVTTEPCLSALLERGTPIEPGKPSAIVTRLLGERELAVEPLKQQE